MKAASNQQIMISYARGIAATEFDGFVSDVSSDKLDLHCVQRKGFVPQANLEWYIPTALIIWLGKSYFETFLKEMGRDHYQLLKAGLQKLWGNFLGPTATPVKLITADGETRQVPKYSLSYSILAQGNYNIEFKILFQQEVSEEDYKHALDAFLAFLQAYHDQTLDAIMMDKLASSVVIGNTLLLEFNLQSRSLEPINPLPDGLRIPQQSTIWLDGQP